jgi:hypothetical protein
MHSLSFAHAIGIPFMHAANGQSSSAVFPAVPRLAHHNVLCQALPYHHAKKTPTMILAGSVGEYGLNSAV